MKKMKTSIYVGICLLTFVIVISGCTNNSNAVSEPNANQTSVLPKDPSVIEIHADFPYFNSVKELYNKADIIAVATVDEVDPPAELNVSAISETPSYFVYTVSHLTVEQVIKGDNNLKELDVKQLGGDTGEKKYIVNDMVYLEKGNRYLLFLKDYGNDKPMSLLNADQSLVQFTDEKINYKDEIFTDTNSQDMMNHIKGLE